LSFFTSSLSPSAVANAAAELRTNSSFQRLIRDGAISNSSASSCRVFLPFKA